MNSATNVNQRTKEVGYFNFSREMLSKTFFFAVQFLVIKYSWHDSLIHDSSHAKFYNNKKKFDWSSSLSNQIN
jgi:hypothetical protein